MKLYFNIFDGVNKFDPVIKMTVQINCSTLIIIACILVILFFNYKK